MSRYKRHYAFGETTVTVSCIRSESEIDFLGVTRIRYPSPLELALL